MFDKSYSGDVAIAASQSVKEREYWLEKLSGEPVKNTFLYDNKKSGYNPGDIDSVDVRFTGELFSRLAWLSNQSDARLLTILSAGLILLLEKYNGSRDIIVGMPIYKQEIEGDFINTVVALRCLLQDDMTFKDLLYRVKQTIDEAVKHQNYPIKTLLYDLDLPFSQYDFPLFDIIVMVKNIQDPAYVSHISTNMKFIFFRTPEFLELTIEYNRSLYNKEDVERIIGHFFHLLKVALFNVDATLTEFDILPEEERKKLLEDFNNTWKVYDEGKGKTIHRIFEEQVEQTPDSIAAAASSIVEIHKSIIQITYRELNKKSNRLSHLIRGQGVEPDAIISIMAERSIELIAGMIGILKAGAAYLPIDPYYPSERVKYMLQDSDARILLNADFLVESLTSSKQLNSQTSVNPSYPHIKPHHLAYIIYTSGTSGKPKGVLIQHQGIVNLVHFHKEEFETGDYLRASQVSSQSFDAAAFEIWPCLLRGACLYIVPDDIRVDSQRMKMWLIQNNITASLQSTVIAVQLLDEEWPVTGIALKILWTAGDRLTRFLKRPYPFRFYNLYGPTEDTIWTTWMEVPVNPGVDTFPSIGRPIANHRVYILRNNNELQPIGVTGELCISGVGISRGYLNKPELTAEKFVDIFGYLECNKQAKLLPVRVYKTGDRSRWLPGGNIEFMGRVDYQVKIRGFRIELGEIERQLLAHPDINETIVTALENDGGDQYLCAYIVSARQLTAAELREYLASRLPDYMIPAYFVLLEKMPLTANGKIDRKQLPPPSMARTAGEYAPPQDRLEKQMVDIWAEILGIETDSISIDANFFELGGHSLKATVLINRIIKEFNVKIAMVEIFKSPDIRSIVKLIKGAIRDIFVSISPAEEKAYYPLSPGQRRLFILHQMDFKSLAYNVTMTFVLGGKLDEDKLARSFRQLITRHESLRTSFTTIGEHPVQIVHRDAGAGFKIEYYNGGSLDNFELANIVNNFVRPFDLSQAPLLRVGLVAAGAQDHILTVDLHHIITDGVSQKILIEDFMNLYQERPLPALRLQYRDYSEWQQGRIVKDLFQQQEEFWMQQLAGDIPKLDLPADFPRPAVQSFAGNAVGFQIDREKTTALHAIASSQNATLFMVLFAVYNIFLSKISNQEDIVVGTPVAGRRHADLEQIIGVFINMLALRNAPNGESTFSAFLKSLTQRTIQAFDNQDYAFEDLVDKIVKDRDVTRNPLFDVMFVMQNMFDPTGTVEAHETGGMGLKPYSGQERKSAQFDLTLYAVQMGDTLNFIFEYGTSLFREETIARFIQYFNKVIASVIESPGKLISGIEVITEEEKARILNEFNATGAEYPVDKTIHQLFEEQVAQTPDRVGLVGDVGDVGQVGLTYQKLNEQSGQLAQLLIEKGVLSDNIVAIKIDRSVEMIVGIMGILKSGGAYLPIDPEYPRERIEYMLKDSGARIMIGRVEERKSGRAEFVFSCFFPASPLPRFLASGSSNLAYIIYTSGSTGNPKGVMIEHRSVINFIKGITDIIPFTPGDCILSLTTISFDIFGLETILPLTKGAKVVIGSQEEQLETRKIALAIEREHVTIFQVIPTRLKLILTDKESSGALKRLKYLLVGGEEFPPALLEGVGNATEGKIYNVYGPTETTIWSTIRDLTGEKTVDIGKPLANTLVYILNKNDRLQPLSVPGELYIGGAGLARGYVNRPEITAEKFIEFNRSYRSDRTYIFYKTGDLARWLPGGNIEFLGRIDQQVKIRGFRIELGEIESRLSNYPSIKEAVVIAREDESGDKYLCAYITADTELAVSGLREYLTKDLPDYMIPSYFVPLEKIPLTPNGKLDRKALPGPKVEASLQYAAPRDKVEEKLVAIWADMLRIDKSAIGIDDNFFVLGGHSLRATLMIGRIHKELNVKFPLLEVFKTPNIRSMAKYIKGAVKEEFISLEPLEQKEYYPVSSQQKRLFILQQRYLNLTAYNRPNLFISPVKLNKEKMELTFRKLIQRHESLRTSFDMINGEPVQRIHRDAPLVIEYYNGDLTGDQTGNFVRPFDLSQAPLFRVRIIKPGDGKNILLVDIHHIISDGVSDTILISDFMALFEGKQLPALKFQYKDFSQWQARLLESGGMTKQEKYWLETFTGEIPQLAIPRDYPDSLERRFEGSGIYVELDDKTTGLLKELAMREGTTLFMILFAVYNVLLAKLGGQEDIVVGTGVAGRRHVDFENVIGMFVNTLALRNYPAAEKTFKDFLFEVNQRTLLAFENQDYVFEDLVEKVVTKSDPGRNPIFDTVFVMQNMASKSETAAAGNEAKPQLLLKRQEFDAKISIFDISVFTEEIGGKLGIKVSYSTGVFKQETIEKYFGYYKDILAYVIENKELIFKLKDIRLASGLKVIESKLIKNETGDFGF